jgi:hypothetical protein
VICRSLAVVVDAYGEVKQFDRLDAPIDEVIVAVT